MRLKNTTAFEIANVDSRIIMLDGRSTFRTFTANGEEKTITVFTGNQTKFWLSTI